MKFGGSSVRDAQAVDRVSEIIGGRLDERPVLIVSAMGGTTDELSAILEALESSDGGRAGTLSHDLAERHRSIVEEILPEGELRRCAMADLDGYMESLGRYIDGMTCLGEVSPRSRDAVLSLGELISSSLLARFLESRSLPAKAVDPRRIMVTDDSHGEAVPLIDETTSACRQKLSPLVEIGVLPVMGGFVGATKGGATTTLGRGGSDLSASIVAGALGATRLEFWKDVDGILTADPRIVEDARRVASLTFREAAELAFLGAKVLHPASIQPAVAAGIPVKVLNSCCPEAPGTEVCASATWCKPDAAPVEAITAIAHKKGQVLVNVHSNRMLGASGFLRRVFEVFDRLKIPVDHIATSEVNVTLTMSPTPKLETLREDLAEIATVRVQTGTGIVSLVGERLSETPGVASEIFGALGNINVSLITYGGSGVNMSLAVPDSEVTSAVRRLHGRLLRGTGSKEEVR